MVANAQAGVVTHTVCVCLCVSNVWPLDLAVSVAQHQQPAKQAGVQSFQVGWR